MLLIAPCHPRAKLKTYRERSFQHAAPKEWNNLPLVIRDSPSVAIYKKNWKLFYLNLHLVCSQILFTEHISIFIVLYLN